MLFITKNRKKKETRDIVSYSFSLQDKMQVDQEEGGHQKCHAEHIPEEEIDHTGTKTKVCSTITVLNCSVGSDSATPWIVACQAPLSMGFSRQEYGSGLPIPSQGIFPTQGLNLGLLHCKQILYHLNH